MTQITKYSMLVIAMTLLLPAAGMAERGKSGQHTRGAMDQPGMISGTVQDVTQARARDGATNKIVLLRTDQGQVLAVDLGPSARLEQVQIKRGTPLTVHGSLVTVNNEPYFMAQWAAIGGEQLQVTRGPTQAARGMRAGQTKQFTGNIASAREVDVKGTDEKHTLAVIRTDQGSVIADLGPTSKLTLVDLDQGEQIKVRGTPTRIDGRAVLVASQLESDGRRVKIERQQR